MLAVPLVVASALERHEAVADVAHRPDQCFVLAAELGPEPPDVDIHGPGTAEVVIPPHLLEEVRPGEDPPRVLGEELQQLELLEGQVERPAAQPGGVGGFVDGEVTRPDLVRGIRGRDPGPAAQGQPQPGFHLGRSRRVQDHIIGAPVGAHRREPAFGHDDEQWAVQAGGQQQLADAFTMSQVAAGVDQDHLARGSVDQGRGLGRHDPD